MNYNSVNSYSVDRDCRSQKYCLMKVFWNHARHYHDFPNLVANISPNYLRTLSFICCKETVLLDLQTNPLIISYHLFRFLIGQYSVAEIRYFIKKRNERDKNTNFFMKKKTKKRQKSICKYKVAFFTVKSPHWPVMQHARNFRNTENI